MKRDVPFEIAPGDTVELKCTLLTPRPGEFSSDIHLYVDDLGLRELTMTVHGEAVTGETKNSK